VSFRPPPLEALGDARAGHHLQGPRPGQTARRQFHLRPQGQGGRADPAEDDIPRGAADPLWEGDQDDQLFRDQGPPSGAEVDLPPGFDHRRLVAGYAALDFRDRALPDDHDVVERSRFHEGFLQSRRQHQDGGEDKDHQGHAGDRQGRGQAARPEIPQGVAEGEDHQAILRNPSAMRMPTAR